MNDAINKPEMNDFEARQDTLAGPSDTESEDLENEENAKDEVDEEPIADDEGEEESEEMDDEDDAYTDEDVEGDEDVKNRYLEISSCYKRARK